MKLCCRLRCIQMNLQCGFVAVTVLYLSVRVFGQTVVTRRQLLPLVFVLREGNNEDQFTSVSRHSRRPRCSGRRPRTHLGFLSRRFGCFLEEAAEKSAFLLTSTKWRYRDWIGEEVRGHEKTQQWRKTLWICVSCSFLVSSIVLFCKSLDRRVIIGCDGGRL